MMNQDGVYDHSKGRGIVSEDPEPSLLRYDYMGPFANVRPPLPQINMFPPRYGYRTRELGIMDVMDVNDQFQPTRVDFTREQGAYSGTARNVSESVW
jgi:hypothetical protein